MGHAKSSATVGLPYRVSISHLASCSFDFYILQCYYAATATSCTSTQSGDQCSGCSRKLKRGSSTGACPFPFQARAYFQSRARPSGIWQICSLIQTQHVDCTLFLLKVCHKICLILVMVLIQIIQGPITQSTPIIISAAAQGNALQACMVAQTTTTVDNLTVSRFYQPPGAICGSNSTLQSAAPVPMAAVAAIHPMGQGSSIPPNNPLLSGPGFPMGQGSSIPLNNPLPSGPGFPMGQGSSILPNNPLPSGPGFPMGPRHFKLPDSFHLFSTAPDGVFASSATLSLYKHELQNHPFSPLATLGSTSAFIPPSDGGIFNPTNQLRHFTTFSSGFPSTTEKQAILPVPAHSKPPKCHKLNELLADQQDPSIGLPATNKGSTSAVMAPIPVPSFDWPTGMPREEYLRLLHTKIAAESELDG
jgi:hypothetical protein